MKRQLLRELLVDGGLIVAGIVLLPVAVFFVGQTVFGPYEGDGYGGFYGALWDRLAGGELSAWFLVLSPLILILVLRGVFWGWRAAGRGSSAGAE